LAPSFASLQLKKFELEFAVDPLFKKATADFDEGGAKGLLLNHLMIDSQGRIVFDSSDDAADAAESRSNSKNGDEDRDADEEDNEASIVQDDKLAEEEDVDVDVEIDVATLGARFFPDLSRLDELDICPSLKTFDLGNPSGSMDIPFLKAPEDWRQEHEKDKSQTLGDKSGLFIDEDHPAGFDDDDLGLGAFDMGGDIAFGEGGEAWAREAALEPQMRIYDAGMAEDGVASGEGVEMLDQDTGDYVVSMTHAQKADKMHEDILGYFDQALQKNWTSAEHWRIRKVKDVNKVGQPTRVRKEKEPFEIDFSSPLDQSLAEVIYTKAASNSAICMPKKDWKSKTKNLLPDDKHFNSKQLLSLFLKPKARLGRRRTAFAARGGAFGNAHVQQDQEVPEGEMDEAFWAQQKEPTQNLGEDTVLPQGDYDANFFQDDALPFAGGLDDEDDMEFADAREHFSPGADADGGLTEGIGVTTVLNGETVGNLMGGAFGTQLVTATRRIRPDYVQYARVAKKVDVRRLKEEIWRGMGFEKLESVSYPSRCVAVLHPCGQYTTTRDSTNMRSTGRQRLPPPDATALGPGAWHAAGERPDAEVHRRDERPPARVPQARHGRHLDELLLHLPAASGQREGARHLQDG
jgi:condensin complex subunit 2